MHVLYTAWLFFMLDFSTSFYSTYLLKQCYQAAVHVNLVINDLVLRDIFSRDYIMNIVSAVSDLILHRSYSSRV